jgi:RNA polymerase sigma-70 factor (ECF subfamily)
MDLTSATPSSPVPAQGDFPVALRVGLVHRDPTALQAFFDLYFDRVYGYVRRLVPDEHLAEDLTQEVFLHVQRALSTYDPERDPRPWLFTIATNKLRDHWRSRAHAGRHDVRFDQDELSERLPSSQPPPESGMADAELAERVRAAIDQLPEGLRATVLLRVYENLSFEEIGRIVERNEVAARKRYSRALEALREVLCETWRLHAEGSR